MANAEIDTWDANLAQIKPKFEQAMNENQDLQAKYQISQTLIV